MKEGILRKIASRAEESAMEHFDDAVHKSTKFLFDLLKSEKDKIVVARRMLMAFSNAAGVSPIQMSEHIAANEITEDEKRVMSGGDMSRANVQYATIYLGSILGKININNLKSIHNIPPISTCTTILYEQYDEIVNEMAAKDSSINQLSKNEILANIGVDYFVYGKFLPNTINGMTSARIQKFLEESGKYNRFKEALIGVDNEMDESLISAYEEYYGLGGICANDLNDRFLT